MSLSRCVELGVPWKQVLGNGLVGSMVCGDLVPGLGVGDLTTFWESVDNLFAQLGDVLHRGGCCAQRPCFEVSA